jgi:hypothetical protein
MSGRLTRARAFHLGLLADLSRPLASLARLCCADECVTLSQPSPDGDHVSDQTVDGPTDDHDDGRADYFGADKSGVLGDPAWRSIFADPVLSRPPTPGSSGDVPVGDDLRLDIGWDRFEQLLVFVAQGVLGLDQVRFRRYGVSGQAQHGIDLAGRCSDGGYTVVQCKEYDTFTPADLRAAVAKFATSRPRLRSEGMAPDGAALAAGVIVVGLVPVGCRGG